MASVEDRAMSPTRRRILSCAGAMVAVAALPAVAGKTDGGSMYGLIGSFKATAGRRDALLAILLENVGDMPGCLAYVVAEDPGDPDGIWITEVWDSAGSHKASLEIPAVKDAIARAMPLIAGFGQRTETRPVGGHGLQAGA